MKSATRTTFPDGRRKLSVRGGWSPELQAALEEGWCDYIYVHAGDWPDFLFLERFSDKITGLTVASPVDSMSGVESLVNLRTLVLSDAPSPPLDLTVFRKLEVCDVYWHKKYSPDFFLLPNLRRLILRHYSEKDCSCISQAKKLSHLSIIQGAIQCLKGCEQLKCLELLELVRLYRLVDASAAAELTNLRSFHIERCSKITDVGFVSYFVSLRELYLDCGGDGFADVKWLLQLQSLVDILIAVPVHFINWDVIFRLQNLKRVVINSCPGYQLDDSELFELARTHGRILKNYIRAGTKKYPGFKFWIE